jgi:UDP-glucose 4-epimerase
MRAGKTPTIFGNGKKTRDYVYVEDVAHASLLGLTRGKNTTINIATASEVSDYEVFKAIAEATNFKKEPRFTPTRPGEVQKITLSFAKAKKILGWEPRMKFKEGVARAVGATKGASEGAR